MSSTPNEISGAQDGPKNAAVDVLDERADCGDHHAGKAAEPAQHADREDAADIFATDRGLDRLDDDHGGAAERGRREREPESDALDLRRIGGHQAQCLLVLRNRLDGAADEGARQEELQAADHRETKQEWHQQPPWQLDEVQVEIAGGVPGLHRSVVHAEGQDQPDLGNEQGC